MRAFCRLSCTCLCALVLFAVAIQFPTASLAQEASAARESAVEPHPLITQPVDETQRTVLKGNTHPLAKPIFDLGTAPATLPMQRMLLVLKRSPQQEAALRKLLDDQQDKSSPNYHKWLTPAQFGEQFGPSDGDMQTITLWLQSHGFQVGSTKGRSVLEFSGSASQVKDAFHTTIHKYVVKGEQHWANASDPSIPTALTPAVAGVLTLHNFLKKPQLHFSPHPVAAHVTKGRPPQITFPDGTHGLTPADYDTIYNGNSVLSSNAGYEVAIGVVARSNLYVEDSGSTDVNDFRQAFLPGSSSYAATFNVYLNGPDPGDLGGGEETEVTLDATWAGAIASSATVDLWVSASTNTSDGVDLSEVAIIEHNLEDVMTESFGSCEAETTASSAAGIAALAEQAAAQGITYLVSAGDSGAEGCDDPDTESSASGPVSVNVLASTLFNTAVGGTIFNEHAQSGTYWTSSNSAEGESAISYIPENVWNESCTSGNCTSGNDPGIWAGGGGASIYSGAKPVWQSGVTGIPQDNTRDLPDVSLTAAGHDAYVLCLEGSCVPNSSGEIDLFLVGGTSASAPSFASIMALVVNQVRLTSENNSQRVGQANYVLYRLAAAENGTLTQCNASSTAVLPTSTCVFNDITSGNNAVPGEMNYGSPSADYQAGVGYDLATGLGSVNIANLVNQWNSVAFDPTTTTLSITEQPIVHGSSVPFTVIVSPSSGSGTPTGDVSLLAALNNDAGFFDYGIGLFPLNATGSVASSTSNLPGGVYLLEAHYAGDSTYASSSGQATVDVTPEPSTTTLSVLSFNSQGNQFTFTAGPFGSFVYLRADVAGLSGHGTPTGGVTFSDSFGPIPGGGVYQLNAGDQPNAGAYTVTPNGILTFDTGTHIISGSYGGDGSFNPSASTQSLTFTIQPGFFAAVPSSQSQVLVSAPGASGSASVAVAYSTGFTGTIALACSTLPAGAACVFSPASIKGSGAATTTNCTITVTTTAATATLLPQRRTYLAQWFAGMSVLFSMMIIGAPRRRRARGMFLVSMLLLIFLVPGCGGGSSSTPPPPPPAVSTPAGTYNVVVNATSGTSISSTGFTLVVQ
jgi:Pro-kumamolisin, activation domain/Bacterial Ig-like domain (group 3)